MSRGYAHHPAPSWKAKGQIWLVDFMYEEGGDSKVRPGILMQRDETDGDIWDVMYVTSQVEKDWFPDYCRIGHWREAGLKEDSAVRACKTQRITESDLLRYVGRLHPADMIQIQRVCSEQSMPPTM